MSKDKGQRTNHRVLICSFVALASGFFGATVGGQLSWTAYSQQCEAGVKKTWSLPGIRAICQTWATPGALFKGSTTGLWTGMILGAFVAGLATHEKVDDEP